MKKILTRSLIAGLLAAFAACPAFAEKNDWTLSFPETKPHFVKVQMTWAKDNPDWQPTKEELEAMFDRLDTDKDGKLSQEEWDSRNGSKKAKKDKKKKKD